MSLKPPMQPKPSKHRLVIGILLAVVLLGGIVSFIMSGDKSPRQVSKKAEVMTITLPPPPVLPPPPKVEPPKNDPPPDEKKDEIVEAPPLEQPPPEAPAEPPSEVLGTGIKGDGPGMNGLGASGNGRGNHNSIGGGASQQARVDWYAKKVLKDAIKEALERNPATKHLVFENGMRIWIEKGGRIKRTKPLGDSSNAAALEQALIGVQTSQAPPTGMPSYIDYQMKGRKQSL